MKVQCHHFYSKSIKWFWCKICSILIQFELNKWAISYLSPNFIPWFRGQHFFEGGRGSGNKMIIFCNPQTMTFWIFVTPVFANKILQDVYFISAGIIYDPYFHTPGDNTNTLFCIVFAIWSKWINLCSPNLRGKRISVSVVYMPSYDAFGCDVICLSQFKVLEKAILSATIEKPLEFHWIFLTFKLIRCW